MTPTDALHLAQRTDLTQLDEQALWDFTLLLDPHCDQLPVNMTIFSAWLDATLLMSNTAVSGVDYSQLDQRIFNSVTRRNHTEDLQ
jgi:hypothetical protein